MTHSKAQGHRPGRKGHKVLRHLTAGRASMADLAQAIDAPAGTPAAERLPHLISAMCREGLIAGGGGLYWITAQGERALARLDAGERVGGGAGPSVRIFKTRAA